MRSIALLVTATSIIAFGAVIACSSSDTPAAEEADAGTPGTSSGTTSSSGSSGESSSGSSGESSGNSSGSSGTSSGTSGSNNLPDAGKEGGGGTSSGSSSGQEAGAGDGGAGALCLPTSLEESETNNDAASADVVPNATSTFCGKIASGTDVDYIKFTLPADASKIGFAYYTSSTAAYQAEVTADGSTFPLDGTPMFKAGKEYVIKVSSKNATSYDYRIKVCISEAGNCGT